MNLFEWEGKKIFSKYNIKTPNGKGARSPEGAVEVYSELGLQECAVKAQVLSGKRGKNNGIRFCLSWAEVEVASRELFSNKICNKQAAAVLIEEKLNIQEEHYISITYDTNKKMPVLVYSKKGGIDIEDVESMHIEKYWLDIQSGAPRVVLSNNKTFSKPIKERIKEIPYSHQLWDCFKKEDARLVEINPLVKTTKGRWIAADAKIILDEDAFFRHDEWKDFEERSMMGREKTEREKKAKKIDEGEAYYRGTAGKYIELDGDIAILFSGGGASIANMDALINAGGNPANYTEYSGNPPRKKVYELTKVVLSKPCLRGLWIAGGVANFTNIKETFQGIIDALDELTPNYPIVVRRDGPFAKEGFELLRDCAIGNNLNIKMFGKETSMTDSAKELMNMIHNQHVNYY